MTSSSSFLDTVDPGLLKFIKKCYGMDHRYYHTWDHVLHMLNAIDSIDRSEWDRFYNEACYAALFHDIIYSPLLKDNEFKSIKIATTKMEQYNIPDNVAYIPNVNNFISITTYHGNYDTILYTEEKLFLDCDMAIFGDTYENFKLYCLNIEREYVRPTFTDAQKKLYARKRAEFLLSVYRAKNIYRSEPYRELYEKQAKENIERYFGELLSLSMESQ